MLLQNVTLTINLLHISLNVGLASTEVSDYKNLQAQINALAGTIGAGNNTGNNNQIGPDSIISNHFEI